VGTENENFQYNRTSLVVPSPGDETNLQQRQSEWHAKNQRSQNASQDGNLNEGEKESTATVSAENTHNTHSEGQILYAVPAQAPTANGFLPRPSNPLEVDEKLLHTRLRNIDTNEKALPEAQSPLPKSSNTNKMWKLPPSPDVDPCGFEDPISDRFWKNVWVACALHNVSSQEWEIGRFFD
jgi:hypothetical protein